MKSMIPGVSQLHLEVWDYNKYMEDELIGETIIDIENRYFSKKWRSLRFIPIETRDLYHPSSTVARGRVKLWLEIIDLNEKNLIQKRWDIQPKAPAVRK
jgi:Ca2+-dependent lipid-binding protein